MSSRRRDAAAVALGPFTRVESFAAAVRGAAAAFLVVRRAVERSLGPDFARITRGEVAVAFAVAGFFAVLEVVVGFGVCALPASFAPRAAGADDSAQTALASSRARHEPVNRATIVRFESRIIRPSRRPRAHSA